MTVRDTLVAALRAWVDRHDGEIAPDTPEQMADAHRDEVLAAAAATQRAYALAHWAPAPDAGPEARRRADRKLGAAERLIALIDPDPAAPRPRHVRVYPSGTGWVVRWQVGDESKSTFRQTRAGADAWADELRDAGGTGQDGKDTGDGAQPPAGESTRPALGPNGCPFCTDSTNPDLRDHVRNVHRAEFLSWAGIHVPRTERSYWVAIADALNASTAAGMPVGIDIEGILTDHQAWAVVWDREAQRWEVGGYEDDGLDAMLGGSSAAAPADTEEWVICCSPSPRCPNGERRARALERGWTTNGRAGNWLCAEHSPSGFFRPGRTYSREHHGHIVLFRVEHVATPPGGKHLIAFGWRHGPDEGWTPSDADDMDGWTEVGEAR